MSQNQRTGRWLFYSTVAVLVLALGFVTWSSMLVRKRQQILAEVALERVQSIFRVRLDALFHKITEDLNEEVEALREEPGSEALDLLPRWRPFLRSHPTITRIQVADEFGVLRSVERLTDTTLVVYTAGPNDALYHAQVIPLLGKLTTTTELPEVAYEDPRAQVWYGRALEEPYYEAVWYLGGGKDVQRSYMQVSKLLRGASAKDPFRILMFEVDLARSSILSLRSAPTDRYSAALIDANGRMLSATELVRDTTMAQAERDAAALWVELRKRSPYNLSIGDKNFHALVRPYMVNGQTLYTASVMDEGALQVWTKMERMVLMAMVLLVALMVILLGWMWLRNRMEDARIRRQMRFSKAQEQQLAKAIGERDVLSREVHHRVKNNLQIVSSLLNLQASQLDEDHVRHEFLRGKQRIDTIALVHHKLYGLKDLRDVDLKLFFDGLIEALATMHYKDKRTVSYAVRTANLSVDQDSAITLGILFCELVNNSFQHAFPYATGGHVDVAVQPVDGGLYRMLVKDNGKGLSDGFADGPGKLGLDIVAALAEQLDGSFHTHTNGGTTCEVLFRISGRRILT
ncbi:MAG: sensor histidine kinase [Flavobacteriales bacterium]|nr:sensor histidine kinase [Flavobacteriales bacterium]